MTRLLGLALPLLVSLSTFVGEAPRAVAAPLAISYAGRMSDAVGKPLVGPVDLKVQFFRSRTGTDEVPVGPLTFPGVALAEGLFAIDITMSDADFHTLFPATLESAWIQVTDLTHDETYDRQVFGPVPIALKVPIDGTTLAYTSDGKLTLGNAAETGAAVLSALNQTPPGTTLDADLLPPLAGDVAGALGSNAVAKIQGRSVSATPPAGGDFLKWNAAANGGLGQWEPGGVAGASGGTVTSVATGAGLAGGPITGAGTIGLKLSATGGLVTSLGGGADELGIAAGGVKTTMLGTTEAGCGVDGNVLKLAGGVWTCAPDGDSVYTDAQARSAAVADALVDGTTTIAPSQNAVVDALALKAPVTTTIGTAAGSGLAGGGDLSAARALTLDIAGLVAVSANDGADLVAVHDTSAGGIRKMTRTDFLAGADATTASNAGAGAQVYKDELLDDLRFRSLVGGTGVTVTQNTNDVTIATTVTQYTDAAARGAAVADALVDGTTTVAPSQNVVFDGLALKLDAAQKAAASGVASLDSGSKVAQDPASAQTAAGIGKIPVGDGAGKLDLGWLPATLTGKDADTIDGINGASIATLTGAQTLTNKSLDADVNTIRDIDDDDVKAAAGIAQSKIQGLTADLAGKGDVFNGTQPNGALTLGTNDATTLTLETSNAPALTILANGDVGIGTTTPDAPLDVTTAGAAVQETAITIDNPYNLAYSTSYLTYKTAGGYRGQIGVQQVGTGNGGLLTFQTNDTGGTNREWMRINEAGDVGVGTFSPQAKLDVNGAVRIGTTASACSATNEGTQRYNSVAKKMEFCNGTSWVRPITSCRVHWDTFEAGSGGSHGAEWTAYSTQNAAHCTSYYQTGYYSPNNTWQRARVCIQCD